MLCALGFPTLTANDAKILYGKIYLLPCGCVIPEELTADFIAHARAQGIAQEKLLVYEQPKGLLSEWGM